LCSTVECVVLHSQMAPLTGRACGLSRQDGAVRGASSGQRQCRRPATPEGMRPGRRALRSAPFDRDSPGTAQPQLPSSPLSTSLAGAAAVSAHAGLDGLARALLVGRATVATLTAAAVDALVVPQMRPLLGPPRRHRCRNHRPDPPGTPAVRVVLTLRCVGSGRARGACHPRRRAGPTALAGVRRALRRFRPAGRRAPRTVHLSRRARLAGVAADRRRACSPGSPRPPHCPP
jgi:hypothetical protein